MREGKESCIENSVDPEASWSGSTLFYKGISRFSRTRFIICLFVLMLYVPVNNFSVMLGPFPVFLGWTSTKQRIKCLAQWHNTVPPDKSVSQKIIFFISQPKHMFNLMGKKINHNFTLNFLLDRPYDPWWVSNLWPFNPMSNTLPTEPLRSYVLFVCLIWFFTSHQQSFSYKGTGLPGLNQY